MASADTPTPTAEDGAKTEPETDDCSVGIAAARTLLDIFEENKWDVNGTYITQTPKFNDVHKFDAKKGANTGKEWCIDSVHGHDGTSSDKEITGAPSRVFVDGHREWYRHFQLHRDPSKGPAVIDADGTETYILHNTEVDMEGKPVEDIDSSFHAPYGPCACMLCEAMAKPPQTISASVCGTCGTIRDYPA